MKITSVDKIEVDTNFGKAEGIVEYTDKSANITINKLNNKLITPINLFYAGKGTKAQKRQNVSDAMTSGWVDDVINDLGFTLLSNFN